MQRRGFLTLLGSGAAVRLGRRGPVQDEAPWRFVVDRDLRWSLEGAGRAAISGAEVAVVPADAPAFTLAQLLDARRLRGGGRDATTLTVVGRMGDVEVSTTFTDGRWPAIQVNVRGLGDDRALEAVRFLDAPLTPRPGRRAWITGRDSASPARFIEPDRRTEVTSHWMLALLGPEGMALAFAAEDAGLGVFTIAEGRLAAVSRLEARAVGATRPPATTTLTVVPGSESLATLRDLAGATAGPPRPTPVGWCSGPELGDWVSESAIVETLAAVRRTFDPRAFRLIRLDDGYQRAAGDWDVGTRFPHGHRWLTERIHEAGFEAGLWLAPFAVAERSGIPTAHADWLVATETGRPLVLEGRPHWGGPTYALDASRREVQDFLRNLARHAVTEWGYDHLTLDHLDFGLRGRRPGRRLGRVEACRAGLRALREGAARAYVLASRVPLQLAHGLVDGVEPDGGGPGWRGARAAARAAAARAPLDAAWDTVPGPLLLRQPLTALEARAWAGFAAVSGTALLSGDDLTVLDEERRRLLTRITPIAAADPRVLDPGYTGEDAPAMVLARAAEGWWMLALVNWDDETRTLRADLAAHGVRGPLAVYDVWQDARRPNVAGAVTVTVPPHDAVVLGLRRPARYPFVLGTTRHIVQGAVDLEREEWHPTDRVLSGRSVRLGRGPYAVTIAVSPGVHPTACRASVPCEVAHLHGEGRAGAVRLEFPEVADDIEWEVAF